jgi:hypothetical protein
MLSNFNNNNGSPNSDGNQDKDGWITVDRSKKSNGSNNKK